jgi:glyoxylase I family protein
MTEVRFSHIALNCRDPLETEEFYTRYFGFRRARVIPLGQEQIVFLKLDGTYLELFASKEEAPLPDPKNDGYGFAGVRHFAFQVDNVDDKLSEIGKDAKVMLGPMAFDDFIPGWKTVWVSDPDGRIVEISQGFVDQAAPPPFVAAPVPVGAARTVDPVGRGG